MKIMPLAYTGRPESWMIKNGPWGRRERRARVDADPIGHGNMSGGAQLDLVLVDATQLELPRVLVVASIASEHLPVPGSEDSNGALQPQTPDYVHLHEPPDQAALAGAAQRVIRSTEVLAREIRSSVGRIKSDIQVLQHEIVEAHRQFDLVMARLGYSKREA